MLPSARTDPHRHPQAVAGVGRDAGRAARIGPRRKSRTRSCVVLEAAGGQDDGARAGPPAARRAPRHLHAGHPRRPHDESGPPGYRSRARRRGRGTREQGRRPTRGPGPRQGRLAARCSTSASRTPVPPPIGVSVTRMRPRRTDHPVAPPVEPVEREELGLERPAAARLPARVLRVVVGEPGDQPQRAAASSVSSQSTELVAGVDERLGELGQDHPVRERGQVGQRRPRGESATPASRGVRLCRDPHDARWRAPSCRRPGRAFSNSADRAPESAAASAAHEPGGAGAEHDDVDDSPSSVGRGIGSEGPRDVGRPHGSRRGPGVNVAGMLVQPLLVPWCGYGSRASTSTT